MGKRNEIDAEKNVERKIGLKIDAEKKAVSLVRGVIEAQKGRKWIQFVRYEYASMRRCPKNVEF